MKMINKILLFPFILISTAMAEPSSINVSKDMYNSHIKSASIHLDRTSKLYANERMQAPINIRHELANGVRLQTVLLKKMYRDSYLDNDYSWRVSEEDAGFAKVVGDPSSTFTYPASTAQNTWLFVSTGEQNQNEIFSICFELRTSLNGDHKTYSTCQNSNKPDGNVAIYVVPEMKYGPNHFYLEGKGMITGGLYEEIHHVALKNKIQLREILPLK